MSQALLVAVHIVSQLGDAVPDDAAKHARADEVVTLHAIVELRDTGAKKSRYIGDVPKAKLGKKTVTVGEPGGELTITWYKVEPTSEDLTNEPDGSFKWTPIVYAETALEAHDLALVPDVRPTLTPDRGEGLGTMRFKIVVSDGTTSVASPGAEARRRKGATGLADSVHRVSIRRDDSYLGWLTELYGQPYIWASAGATDKTHQSERLEGSDCADFVVYGWRRLGHKVSYTWTEGLRKYTKNLGGGAPDENGLYVDDEGNPVPFPLAGDLVLFPRHVGVLVEDRGVPGLLDTGDVMAHALFESPHEEAIADSGYEAKPVEVLRWK